MAGPDTTLTDLIFDTSTAPTETFYRCTGMGSPQSPSTGSASDYADELRALSARPRQLALRHDRPQPDASGRDGNLARDHRPRPGSTEHVVTEAESTVLTREIDVDEDELQDQLDDLTDLDVYLEVDGHGITVSQGPGSMSFTYPVDVQDVRSWTYHFENDYTVRYEILDDVERLLARHPMEGRDDRAVERLVRELLLEEWIDLDGSELMIMDTDGLPLELSASFRWVTPFVGEVERPYRPDPRQRPRARLHPDGRLEVMPHDDSEQPLEVDLSVVSYDEIRALL